MGIRGTHFKWIKDFLKKKRTLKSILSCRYLKEKYGKKASENDNIIGTLKLKKDICMPFKIRLVL